MPVKYFQKDDASMLSQPSELCPFSKLTGFQRDILFVGVHLNGTHPNGATIKGELQKVYGEKINHSRLYQNLHVLFEKGFYREATARWTDECLPSEQASV